jgi:site-specific DNA-methyltransferase (adenine-specific)
MRAAAAEVEKVTLAGGRAVLYLGDALEVLPTLNGLDAVITDPPYSSGGQFRADRTMDVRKKYLQSDSGNNALAGFGGDNRDQRGFHFWSALWASAALRACKSGAIGAFFSDWRQLPISTDYLQAGGWIWRGLVPWVKTTYRPQMGRFGAQCEYLVWGSAGALPIERGVGCLPGFYQYPPAGGREHVTQKPDGLLDDLIQIVPPGGLVCDPFMGSGTTGVSCVRMGRRFIGIEFERVHFEKACERIRATECEQDLFGYVAPLQSSIELAPSEIVGADLPPEGAACGI